ncbi:MAG: hypothetical protein JST93_26465 [Acidobacteria bacterium]|nr:hypothetical protein [Acidobacteriota bacterium]
MNRRTSHTRRGFALIETTTVLSIIAILIGLLIPAIQPVREATNRSRAIVDLKAVCEAGLALNYDLQNVLISSFRNGYSFRTDLPANSLIAEPAYPGRTGSVTITMKYTAGCPYTETTTAKSNTERQKMYSELLVGAAQIAGLMVNGQSGNDMLALHNSLTGSYTTTVGPDLRDSSGATVSFQSILNPNAVWTGREMWLAAIDMVKFSMRLGAAGENYLTLPSIPVPTTPTGVMMFTHNGMLSLVNAVTDGTSNTVLIAELAALQQNATQAARNAFIQDVNKTAQSGAITLQQADALIDMMSIVY